jgi:hypothetical protein
LTSVIATSSGSGAPRFPSWEQRRSDADDEVELDDRHAQGKVCPVANRESLRDLFEDFAGPIRVLGLHVPVIRHSIPTLEDPLRRQSTTQAVRESALAWNDGGENPIRSQDTLHFSESRRKVVEVFEHVNGYYAIEITVGIWHGLLAIADARRHLGIVSIDRLGHPLPQLDRVVFLRLQILEAKMLPKAGT